MARYSRPMLGSLVLLLLMSVLVRIEATASPSLSPSLPPSLAPSASPSSLPSSIPSTQSSSLPSQCPSSSPISPPSSSPTLSPSTLAPTALTTTSTSLNAIDPNSASYPVNPSESYVWGKVPQSCTCEENGATPSNCAYFQCTCTCDLSAGNCDYGCCCDPDCSEAQVRESYSYLRAPD